MLKNDVCLIATQNRFIKKELKGKEEDVIKFISHFHFIQRLFCLFKNEIKFQNISIKSELLFIY